jgi:hypothetical protein
MMAAAVAATAAATPAAAAATSAEAMPVAVASAEVAAAMAAEEATVAEEAPAAVERGRPLKASPETTAPPLATRSACLGSPPKGKASTSETTTTSPWRRAGTTCLTLT